LTHQSKQNDNRQSIRGKDTVDVDGYQAQRCIDPYQKAESYETGKRHGNADAHARGEEEKQQGDGQNGDD
jgi:hypothetical protein